MTKTIQLVFPEYRYRWPMRFIADSVTFCKSSAEIEISPTTSFGADKWMIEERFFMSSYNSIRMFVVEQLHEQLTSQAFFRDVDYYMFDANILESGSVTSCLMSGVKYEEDKIVFTIRNKVERVAGKT
jgi:hypothetical protein